MALVLTQAVCAQSSAPRKKASKGPRALGLLQLFPNGTAHLIPITILIDGNFYDAGAYKAAPVPMALESQTVYEAVQTGVSKGMFTVGGVRQTKDSWIADGSWLPAGATPPRTAHKAETKPNMGNDEGPPVLHRPGEKRPAQPTSTSAPPDNKQPATASSEPVPEDSDRPVLHRAPNSSDASPKEAPPPAPSSTPATASPQTPDTSSSAAPPSPAPPPDDADHPTLRRGRPSPAAASKQTPSTAVAAPKSPATKSAVASPAPSPTSSKNSVQLIPAISDANGPDPRPYLYETKPDEDEKFRKKVLAMATDELLAKVKAYAGTPAEQPPARPRKGVPAKTLQPVFDDVQLKIFDLSSSNEPVLVLIATAHMPPSPKSEPSTAADMQYFVSLVTRNDIYGDLHKVFSNITDNHHLDVIPRMELVDAVDADGDGRGELLFRKVSDTGSAYNVYRQIGDQLWPLFEGTLP